MRVSRRALVAVARADAAAADHATGRWVATANATADERRTAARTHGGRQMRAASTRVLTMSCAIVCALPRRGHHYRKVKFLDGHQRTRRRVRRPATPEKKPLWLQKLAALLDAMNRRNRRLGLDVPCADDQHNPLGLFIHQARDTLTHDNPHERRLAREHHRAQLIDDQLRRRAETATCAARLAAEHADPDYQTRRRERRETLRATLRAAQQHVRTH